MAAIAAHNDGVYHATKARRYCPCCTCSVGRWGECTTSNQHAGSSWFAHIRAHLRVCSTRTLASPLVARCLRIDLSRASIISESGTGLLLAKLKLLLGMTIVPSQMS